MQCKLALNAKIVYAANVRAKCRCSVESLCHTLGLRNLTSNAKNEMFTVERLDRYNQHNNWNCFMHSYQEVACVSVTSDAAWRGKGRALIVQFVEWQAQDIGNLDFLNFHFIMEECWVNHLISQGRARMSRERCSQSTVLRKWFMFGKYI